MDSDWTVVAAIAATAAAIAALLQVLVLIVAAVFARRQLLEARRLRLDTQRPFVVIDLIRTRPQFMDLVIENVGPVTAEDVQFKFDPPLASTSYDDPQIQAQGIPRLADQPIFKSGIATLAPGRAMAMHFDHIPKRHAAPEMPDRYTVRLSYAGPVERYEEVSILDVSLHRATMHLHVKDLHDIHRCLEQIRDEVANLARLRPSP